MCLIKFGVKNYLEEAKKDIICYKFLIEKNGAYMSPYQDEDYTYWINHPEEFFVDKKEAKIIANSDKNVMMVEDGFVHFYTTLNRAFPSELITYCKCVHLFKCLIPKGNEFIFGDDGTICAKKFRFVEEVNI